MHVCINKDNCRQTTGGNHVLLCSGIFLHRALPGIYKGVYTEKGKASVARGGTKITDTEHSKMIGDFQNSNKA